MQKVTDPLVQSDMSSVSVYRNRGDLIMGYAIPNNCAVMYLGNIEEAAQTSDTYLAKLLLTVSKNTILKKNKKN